MAMCGKTKVEWRGVKPDRREGHVAQDSPIRAELVATIFVVHDRKQRSAVSERDRRVGSQLVVASDGPNDALMVRLTVARPGRLRRRCLVWRRIGGYCRSSTRISLVEPAAATQAKWFFSGERTSEHVHRESFAPTDLEAQALVHCAAQLLKSCGHAAQSQLMQLTDHRQCAPQGSRCRSQRRC